MMAQNHKLMVTIKRQIYVEMQWKNQKKQRLLGQANRLEQFNIIQNNTASERQLVTSDNDFQTYQQTEYTSLKSDSDASLVLYLRHLKRLARNLELANSEDKESLVMSTKQHRSPIFHRILFDEYSHTSDGLFPYLSSAWYSKMLKQNDE